MMLQMNRWEVIVKFFGTTEELRQKLAERFPEEQAQDWNL